MDFVGVDDHHRTARTHDWRTWFSTEPPERFFAVVHLQAGSIRVSVGQQVAEGEQIAGCGNSGNSTQPHVHLQTMDSLDLSAARGLPISFRHLREWPRGEKDFQIGRSGMPGEGSVVEPI